MKRYHYEEWENTDGVLEGWLSEAEFGGYVKYEEAHVIEVDRDIKAANLQLLVEKVLGYDELSETAGDIEFMLAYGEMVDLARSLKQ